MYPSLAIYVLLWLGTVVGLAIKRQETVSYTGRAIWTTNSCGS